MAKRLCVDLVDPKLLTPFLACCLIALDKCPGVRPIGIGDTSRRIIAKAILTIIQPDIQEVAGICAGQKAGVESAAHAARKFGYFVNPYKSWIVTKDHNLEKAADVFRCSNVNITSEGLPYLGVPIGTQEYTSQSKVNHWTSEIEQLSTICPLSTSCCLCSLYTWPVKSMALPPSYDIKYFLLFRTLRNSNTNTVYSSNH